MYNQPARYDFPTHYRGDGLNQFNIVLTLKDGTAIDLTGAKVLMQLKIGVANAPAWTFSSEEGGDTLVTIHTGTDGVISFPEMEAWELKAGVYDYDLEVTDASGFIRTYLRGKWAVNQDVTRRA